MDEVDSIQSRLNDATSSGLYLPPSWQMLIKQIAYLAQFGGSVQVVQGRLGAGKSTLFKWLVDEPLAGEYVAICAKPGVEEQTFLFDLLWRLGMRPEQETTSDVYIKALSDYVKSLRSEGSRVVVAIDDAHLIPAQTLSQMVSVLQSGDQSGFGLHLIFFTAQDFADKIKESDLVGTEIHHSVIPSFSLPQTEQLLFVSGLSNRRKIPIAELKSIWYDTDGLPGAILSEFQTRLTSDTSEMQPESIQSSKSKSMGFPFGHLAAVLVLFGVLIWALLVREDSELPLVGAMADSNDSSLTQGESEEKNTLQELTIDLQNTSSQIYVESAVTDGGVTNEPLGPLPAQALNIEAASSSYMVEGVTAMKLAQKPESPADSGSNIEGKSGSSIRSLDDTVAEKVESASADQAVSTADKAVVPGSKGQLSSSVKANSGSSVSSKKSSDMATSTDPLNVDDAEEILSGYSSSAYVIQLMALSDYEKLRAYASVQPNKENLMIYRSKRAEKTYFILLEGYYADKLSAEAAVVNLPLHQRRGKPWAKSMTAILKDIKDSKS